MCGIMELFRIRVCLKQIWKIFKQLERRHEANERCLCFPYASRILNTLVVPFLL